MLTLHRWLDTWSDRVDLYVALTEFGRRKFIQGGLPAEKIVVKPNFVWPDPGVRVSSGQFALFVGRLSTEKGVETLLRAWKRVGSKVPLKIAGDGPLRPHLERSLSLNSPHLDVEFLGHQSKRDVFRLLKAARCLVFPSEWYEGLPNTVLEAFATGTPVVAADLGAAREVVEDGRTGLLFSPGYEEELATGVRRLWLDARLSERLGRAARREYEDNYTAEKNYPRLLEIYRRALAGRWRRWTAPTRPL